MRNACFACFHKNVSIYTFKCVVHVHNTYALKNVQLLLKFRNKNSSIETKASHEKKLKYMKISIIYKFMCWLVSTSASPSYHFFYKCNRRVIVRLQEVTDINYTIVEPKICVENSINSVVSGRFSAFWIVWRFFAFNFANNSE